MRAVTVTPGRPGSDRLVEIPEPEPSPGEALVEVVSVGVCGTDREIVSEGGGEAPAGEDLLVLGHESLGRVATGAGDLAAGELVVAIVRRPDPVPCLNCGQGQWDMCLNGRYTERGIKGRHGFLSDVYAELPEYLVRVPPALERAGALLEPASVVAKALEHVVRIQDRAAWAPASALVAGAGPIGLLAAAFLRSRDLTVTVYDLAQEGPKVDLSRALGCDYVAADERGPRRLDRVDVAVDATGHAPLALELVETLGPNGVACLLGVPANGGPAEVPAARLARGMVLENKVVFGAVNANRRHFAAAAEAMEGIARRWPGWLERVVTRRVPLDRYGAALAKEPGDVKVLIDL